jgi:predicted transglutaminase-like cysteine proteinase
VVVPRIRPGPAIPAFSLLLAGILCLGFVPAGARDALRGPESSTAVGAGIFRSFEIRAAPLRVNRNWVRVRAAMDAERAAFKSCMADAAACATPVLKSWRQLVVSVAGLDRRGTLVTVNRFFNSWRYRDDGALRGAVDHWASPSEFMSASGDCEDYAIAKYFALGLFGFEVAELRLVAVADRIRGGQHAVLAVYRGDDILILDNVTDRILSHRALAHYVPLRSWSGNASWAHISASRLRPAEPQSQSRLR